MPTLERKADYFVGRFDAMASSCELLIETQDETLAQDITRIASTEVIRIEQKFSRYRNDNLLYEINSGVTVRVDDETGRLLDYAEQLYQLSDGLFDVTSGVLRRAWQFDGSDAIPTAEQINTLLPLVGWKNVQWHSPLIQLPKDMEIDFGGIGKEYAADRVAQLVRAFIAENINHALQDTSVLINLGGDIAVTGPRKNNSGWQIGVDTQKNANTTQPAQFSLKQGGVATSGDANRYLIKDSIRYSHVLDPRNGWPVEGAPSAVTVVADSCTDAGMLSTMALLQGHRAEEFLREQGVPFWCQW